MATNCDDMIPTMSEVEFRLLSNIIHDVAGINLTPNKKPLLVSRLARRLRELGVNFSEYYRIILEDKEEFIRLIDRVSTNKTEFLREPTHFEFLGTRFVGEMRKKIAEAGKRSIRIWSAACSTGEEPYSIALTLLEALGGDTSWMIRILASDICTEALKTAESAIYDEEGIARLPAQLWGKYLLKGVGEYKGKYRFKEFVRRMVEFRRINLKDGKLPVREEFDAIFLRNVLIYFDRPTQDEVVEKLSRHIRDGGYLFLGHSESLQTRPGGFKMIIPSVYIKMASNKGVH